MIYKNVAFIPLRGGSKSIKLKNIKKINNRPLAYWTLDAATKCKHIDKIFVSTDSNEIKTIITEYGSDKIDIIDRSLNTAEDDSSTESAMIEFARNHDFKNIVLIQATSPLLTPEDLDKGFKKFEVYDSVLSVVRQKRFIWEENNYGSHSPINYEIDSRPRRQEFDGFLVENGAFYITSKKALLQSNNRISGKIGLVEMKEETYYEIDELNDWYIVEKLLEIKEKKESNMVDKIKNIKILLTDSDGVLTDGGMYYSETGDELKKFNTRDGMGVEILRNNNIKTIIITGEDVELVKRRGEKLGIEDIYLGVKDKPEIVKEICKKHNVKLEELAYIGDDINDLVAMKMIGFKCSVCDGMKSVIDIADYVTTLKGGQGALREVAEIIIKYKNFK